MAGLVTAIGHLQMSPPSCLHRHYLRLLHGLEVRVARGCRSALYLLDLRGDHFLASVHVCLLLFELTGGPLLMTVWLGVLLHDLRPLYISPIARSLNFGILFISG